jgi:F-type H+-transporting ATPase subunit b
MRKRHPNIFFSVLLAAGMLWILSSGSFAFAGETSENWRPVYDLVMRWVNFLILAFVIVKFGRAPLMNFLRGEEKRIAADIRELEQAKEKALEKVRETEKMLADSEERSKRITERIVQQGERKKEAIIEEARRDSRLMIEDAKRKADGLFMAAKQRFRVELVDAAIAAATKRLTVEMTPEDSDKAVQNYMNRIEGQQAPEQHDRY